MSTNVESLKHRQDQRLKKVEIAQQDGNARLGREQDASSPRGLRRRLERIRDSLRSIFPGKPQVQRKPLRIVALARWLWRVLLARLLRRSAPEPEPKGWPPSWPILMPESTALRQAWKRRFGEVTQEVVVLDEEAAGRRSDTQRCRAGLERLPQRIQNARCIEMKPPQPGGSAPTSPSRRRGRAGSVESPHESKEHVLTLDDLLNEEVAGPVSELEVEGKFSDVMRQFRAMREHIDEAEQEVLQGTV
jgi:hypothetical protein